jgi:hypothetical protein
MPDPYQQPVQPQTPAPTPLRQEPVDGPPPFPPIPAQPPQVPARPAGERNSELSDGEVDPNVDGNEETSPSPAATDNAATTTPFNLYGDVGVVAGQLGTLILEKRKKDLLEGSVYKRGDILEDPFVRDPHWTESWDEAHDPVTGGLAAPILVIVAPRSIGSTTFALRLLAEHATSATTLLKLDPDWPAPSRGRLPLEEDHCFQLDLKDPEHDRVTGDFLDSLPEHAEQLHACRSRLVLTVTQELWTNHRVSPRRGVHVLHLSAAPDARALVEAHLSTHGYATLATSLRDFTQACSSLKGLNAVQAARAVNTIVAAWEEHQHSLNSPAARRTTPKAGPPSLEARITAALTDWREELDGLFGEAPAVHSPAASALTVEDRCLLLALAVQQSAPMPQVAHTADRLLNRLGEAPGVPGQAATLALRGAFAGRGTRRRIHDVDAVVDGQDNVVFDRPAYGQAVLEYVWDNYDVMRGPLLDWLVEAAADSGDSKTRAVQSLAHLTVRHGSSDYLNALGQSASAHPEVLADVMESAVRDEHIGRLAWDTLYRWAGQDPYTLAVISLCRKVLRDSPSTAAEKRAMVRLRRVAHTATSDATRTAVLEAFDELAQQPSGTARLVTEVHGWREKKTSAQAGSLAFLALMTAPANDTAGVPWLVQTAETTGIDVPGAVHDLLVDPHVKATAVLRLVDWIGSCSRDEAAYSQLRETLLPALRNHDMLKAGMALMRKLDGVSTARGYSVADDFYQHLVDPRLQSTFPLQAGPEGEVAA